MRINKDERREKYERLGKADLSIKLFDAILTGNINISAKSADEQF